MNKATEELDEFDQISQENDHEKKLELIQRYKRSIQDLLYMNNFDYERCADLLGTQVEVLKAIKDRDRKGGLSKYRNRGLDYVPLKPTSGPIQKARKAPGNDEELQVELKRLRKARRISEEAMKKRMTF